MDSTLNLIQVAFVLELPVASNAAGCFFDLASGRFYCTFYIFVVHMTPLLAEMHLTGYRLELPNHASISVPLYWQKVT